MYKLFFKRFFDLFFSLIICLVLTPIFLFIYIVVKLDSKGNFFFFQERLGKNGKLFKVFKIRTMTDKPRETTQEIFKGNAEVTKVGAVLRRLKIDELPQFINILKGDMSFVGPRPCLPSLQEKFDENALKRMLVRPGLTGLAQTNGNIYLTWEERWKYDRYYVENISFLLDVQIFIKTIQIVFKGEESFLKKPNV
ncbi:sugar transferase [Polaribacter sp. MSW13]|uniref:Sugar transferase n=1 Tax=Polaribacter marinus TaxID=2916838 RepID=A0A9X2AKZ7_9FLAO|nr:sugar transferase [Polaribacter marinus]MCI2227549.1 sugar transferase [Polaribacter marinus]